nr:GNAT family acetyltransferase [Cyanidium caldarium]
MLIVNYINRWLCSSIFLKDLQFTYDKVLFIRVNKESFRLIIQSQGNLNLNLDQLNSLCSLVGWDKRPLGKLKKVIIESFQVFIISSTLSGAEELLGFARVTSDSAFFAVIWDFLIHPKFQKRGLGTLLILEIIKELKKKEIIHIFLFADIKAINFYKRIGFSSHLKTGKAMFWHP